MKDIDSFLKGIVSDLPMNESEKEEFKEELYYHLKDHMNDLMVKGYSEDEAVQHAIRSFGNDRKINWELKKAIFPFYKVIRYFWNIIFVTAFLSVVSYATMEFYHPEFDNSVPAYSIVTGLILVAFLTGITELLYESVSAEYHSKWLTNPWIFFLVPSLFIGVLMSFSLISNPEQYILGRWLDLFAIPIGAIAHLISRQLFTFLFIKKRNRLKFEQVS